MLGLSIHWCSDRLFREHRNGRVARRKLSVETWLMLVVMRCDSEGSTTQRSIKKVEPTIADRSFRLLIGYIISYSDEERNVNVSRSEVKGTPAEDAPFSDP